MKSIISAAAALGAALFSTAATAHSGTHGAEGAAAAVVHLLVEHAYVPALLLAAALVAWRIGRRD